MVQAVRAGHSLRDVAAAFGVSVGTVFAWVERARGKRIDRVAFANRKPGRAWNRRAAELEQRILGVRSRLRQKSVLGEFGAVAIGLALREDPRVEQVPIARMSQVWRTFPRVISPLTEAKPRRGETPLRLVACFPNGSNLTSTQR